MLLMKLSCAHFSIVMCFVATAGGAQTVPDQIDAILSRSTVSANSWSILVETLDGSTTFYARNPDTGLAPASNTKLFTTAAAFGLLGTNYAFQTRVYANGVIANGELAGDLNLVSEHDITWNTSVFSGNARAALDRIAAQLKAKGLSSVTGSVQCYGLCAYNLGSTDYLTGKSTAGRNADAAVAFNAALNAQGISTTGTTAGQTGFNPPGTLFHTHLSTEMTYGGQPLRLGVACIPLNRVSHNVMADGLCRHLGWKLANADSYSGGAGQIIRWLRNSAGLSTNGIVMNDGSGLSSNNRFTARHCVMLTRYMLPAFPSWEGTLPIGCVSGTISSRFCGTDASGLVKAKTGSLSVSIALSGLVDNKHDGRRILFSFLSNKSSINQSETRQAMDDSVVVLAGRAMPISPRLQFVRSGPGGVTVAWSDEEFIRTGYRVYTSPDGVTFGAPIAVSANTHSLGLAGIADGESRFVKVSVVSAGGESKPSRIYAARPFESGTQVLVVDGNDRWQFQRTENPGTTNHAFAAVAARSLGGIGFDTAHHTAVMDGSVGLTNYPAVIWLLGEESTADRTFDTQEQALVTEYLARGGNLFVSGSEIAWDLDRDSGPGTADREFIRTQLKASLGGNANDDAGTYAFGAAAGAAFSGNAASGFDNGTRGTYNVDYPDILVPQNGSTPALTYIGGLGGTAAVQHAGSGNGGRVVFWGFPFETITNAPARDAYMSDVLRFFDILERPMLFAPAVMPGGQTVNISWSSYSGLNYRLEYKEDLSDSSWTALGTAVTATNTICSKLDALTAGRRFYRVALVH